MLTGSMFPKWDSKRGGGCGDSLSGRICLLGGLNFKHKRRFSNAQSTTNTRLFPLLTSTPPHNTGSPSARPTSVWLPEIQLFRNWRRNGWGAVWSTRAGMSVFPTGNLEHLKLRCPGQAPRAHTHATKLPTEHPMTTARSNKHNLALWTLP